MNSLIVLIYTYYWKIIYSDWLKLLSNVISYFPLSDKLEGNLWKLSSSFIKSIIFIEAVYLYDQQNQLQQKIGINRTKDLMNFKVKGSWLKRVFHKYSLIHLHNHDPCWNPTDSMSSGLHARVSSSFSSLLPKVSKPTLYRMHKSHLTSRGRVF